MPHPICLRLFHRYQGQQNLPNRSPPPLDTAVISYGFVPLRWLASRGSTSENFGENRNCAGRTTQRGSPCVIFSIISLEVDSFARSVEWLIHSRRVYSNLATSSLSSCSLPWLCYAFTASICSDLPHLLKMRPGWRNS